MTNSRKETVLQLSEKASKVTTSVINNRPSYTGPLPGYNAMLGNYPMTGPMYKATQSIGARLETGSLPVMGPGTYYGATVTVLTQQDDLLYTAVANGEVYLSLMTTVSGTGSFSIQKVASASSPATLPLVPNTGFVGSDKFMYLQWSGLHLPFTNGSTSRPFVQFPILSGDKIYASTLGASTYLIEMYVDPSSDINSMDVNIVSSVPLELDLPLSSPLWVTNYGPDNIPMTEIDELETKYKQTMERDLIKLKRFQNTMCVTDLPAWHIDGRIHPVREIVQDPAVAKKIVSKIESSIARLLNDELNVDDFSKRLAELWNKLMHAINGNTELYDRKNNSPFLVTLDEFNDMLRGVANRTPESYYIYRKLTNFKHLNDPDGQADNDDDAVTGFSDCTDAELYKVKVAHLGRNYKKVRDDEDTKIRQASESNTINSPPKPLLRSKGDKGAIEDWKAGKTRKAMEHSIARVKKLAGLIGSWQDAAAWVQRNRDHLSGEYVRNVMSLTTLGLPTGTGNVSPYAIYVYGFIHGYSQARILKSMIICSPDYSTIVQTSRWADFFHECTSSEWDMDASTGLRGTTPSPMEGKIKIITDAPRIEICDSSSRRGSTDEAQADNLNTLMRSTEGFDWDVLFSNASSEVRQWRNVTFLSHQARNKLTRALNGNTTTVFPDSMKKVLNKKRLNTISQAGNHSMNLVEFASRISALPSGYVQNLANIAETSFINASRIQITNAITGPEQLLPPEVTCQARDFRVGAGLPTVPNTQRLEMVSVSTHQAEGKALELTTIGREIYEKISAKGIVNQNRNTMGLNGFPVNEIFQQASDMTVNWWNGESLYMKWLLQLAMSQELTPSPLSNIFLFDQVELVDPNSNTDPTLQIVRSINSGAIFGEDCGGTAAPIFPVGGQQGTLSIHVTTDTIPPDQATNAIFLPKFFFNSTVNANRAIALIILGFSPWPYCMNQLEIDSLDNAGVTADTNLVTDNISTVYIPGSLDIHVVLPRNDPGPTPGSQGDANSVVSFRPAFGPVATRFAANEVMNISFAGAIQQYGLVDYLVSHALSYSPAEIVEMMTLLDISIPDRSGWEEAYRKTAYLTTAYKSFNVAALGDLTYFPGDSIPGFRMFLASGIPRTQTLQDFPVAPEGIANVLYVGQSRERSFSKLMSGAFSTDAAVTKTPMPSHFTNPSFRYYSTLLARTLAATYQTVYREIGMTASIMNTGLGQTQMHSFRSLVRAFYAFGSQGQSFRSASWGEKLLKTWNGLTDWTSNHDRGCYSLFQSHIYPRDQFHVAYDNFLMAYVDGVVIQTLPDIWYQMTSQDCPLAFSPFPPGFKKMGLIGIVESNTHEFLVGNGVRYGTWHSHQNLLPNIHQNNLLKYSDEEIWNDRVAWHTGNLFFTVQSTDFSGALNLAAPLPGSALFQQRHGSSFRLANIVFSRLTTACTTWIPQFNENGIRYWLSWTAADANTLNRIMGGVITGYIENWQIGETMVPVSILRDFDEGVDPLAAFERGSSSSTTTTESN